MKNKNIKIKRTLTKVKVYDGYLVFIHGENESNAPLYFKDFETMKELDKEIAKSNLI